VTVTQRGEERRRTRWDEEDSEEDRRVIAEYLQQQEHERAKPLMIRLLGPPPSIYLLDTPDARWLLSPSSLPEARRLRVGIRDFWFGYLDGCQVVNCRFRHYLHSQVDPLEMIQYHNQVQALRIRARRQQQRMAAHEGERDRLEMLREEREQRLLARQREIRDEAAREEEDRRRRFRAG
jgi:hypothetical protein